MSSSGFGDSGAWASWLAYGPGVRSGAGLTALWRYPDDPAGFGDTTTVYPDHAAARIAGVAILATLVRRRSDGVGADIRVSQAEVVLNQLTEQFARDSAGLAPTEVQGAPWGAFRCAGDDEWCVICVRDDDDWASLSKALDNPAWCDDPRFADASARLENHALLNTHVQSWAENHSPDSIMSLLQAHGVPAGVMNRPPELVDDPHLLARDYLTQQIQPGFAEPLTTVKRPFLAEKITSSAVRASPEMGQDTVAICAELLGMSSAEIDRLVQAGILQPASETS